MTTTTTVEKRLLCPSCGQKGKRVSTATVQALLKDEYVSEVLSGSQLICEPTANGDSGCTPLTNDTGWRFCDSPDCDVVYFAEDSGTIFTRTQLRVSVGVKEKTGERPLCYCFGHTMASIKKKLLTTGRSDALEDIRAKMKDPGCHCEVTNPSGACCLGSVAKGIETAKAELNSAEPSAPAGNKAETITKIGTVLSAVMASSCCWLPLALLAFGVSGAGIAGTMETYRPLFMVLTFGFLAAAFYFTYRPRKSQASEGDCCSTGSDCRAVSTTGTQRLLSLMTLNKVMLWGVTLLAVLFLFFPNYVGFFLASQAGESETTTTSRLVSKTTIAIEGMTCEACSVTLQKAIKDVPGVLGAKVDFKKGQAVVSTETGRPFPKDEILHAVTDSGYSGTVVELKP
ncbi:MAG: cation transporter [Planctomycetales bacterium]|nr:cation transporter [Planctomycetales bacterium]